MLQVDLPAGKAWVGMSDLAVDFSIIKEHQWRVFKAQMNELYARDAVKCRTQYGDVTLG
jgi:hypothetical protein